MFALLRHRSQRPLSHPVCSGLALVGYLLVALGVPLPGPAATAKDRTHPFPCQDHPCGCANAEDCWRHCCCFSPEQKLAWARAHAVEPPSYAETPSSRGWHAARLRDQDCGPDGEAPARACCAHRKAEKASGKDTTCQTTGARTAKKASCCHGSCEHRDVRGPHGRQSKWRFSMAARSCQGFSTSWVTTGAVVPPAPPVHWQPCWAPPESLSYADVPPLALLTTPPEPPPRV